MISSRSEPILNQKKKERKKIKSKTESEICCTFHAKLNTNAYIKVYCHQMEDWICLDVKNTNSLTRKQNQSFSFKIRDLSIEERALILKIQCAKHDWEQCLSFILTWGHLFCCLDYQRFMIFKEINSYCLQGALFNSKTVRFFKPFLHQKINKWIATKIK